MGRSRDFQISAISLIYLAIAGKFCAGVKVINGCPEHFARVSMHCTTILLQQVPYAKADQECRNKAAIMFMIKDKATYDALLNARLLMTNIMTRPVNSSEAEAKNSAAGMPPMPGNLMMGLKYTSSDKKWTWSDGTFYNPTSDWAMWMSGSPPTPNKDGCVVWKKKGKGAAWDLADCNQPGMSICYANATSKVQTCPDRYMQEEDLCVMPLMKLDSSYNGGAAECKAASDGTVAMLKKESEFDKIKSLGSGMLGQLPVPIWMGLKYTATDKKWKWSDGEEYHMGSDWGLWKGGAPPATPSSDTCVTMIKSGESFDWNPEDCNAQKGLVVCVKKATEDPSGASTGNVGPAAPSGGGGSNGAMMVSASLDRIIQLIGGFILMVCEF